MKTLFFAAMLLLCMLVGCNFSRESAPTYPEATITLNEAKPLYLANKYLREAQFDKFMSTLSAPSLAELTREMKLDPQYLHKLRKKALAQPEEPCEYYTLEQWIAKVGTGKAADLLQMAANLPSDQVIVVVYQHQENWTRHGPAIVSRQNEAWKVVVRFRPIDD